MPRILLILSALCLLLSSCVYDREMAYFNEQIVSLNRRVATIQEAAGGDLQGGLENMQSNQARFRLEIDQLQTEVSSVSGRTEDNEHIIRRIVEQDLSRQDAMMTRIEELTEQVDQLSRLMQHQYQHLGLEPPKELTALEPREELPVEIARPAPPPTPTPHTPMPRGETELYQYALALHREEGKHEEAREAFRRFLDVHPESGLVENAHFWIAETFVATRQYEQAILSYQNVIKDFPAGNKVANAIYRQALAFLEIEDKTSARLLLNKVINEHPGTSDAELARRKLDTL